ncbi:hypothetical protein QAD02_024374 [Eretmocerus hayati]|uniref:Uncharacterized protein n=1 Tax=Eretmocerus hayati TaxID=131215 RepID=A0ACC2Q135_9HYME|nr:hypothetical protein QAD02_024374 [Eretmocerus hayati]
MRANNPTESAVKSPYNPPRVSSAMKRTFLTRVEEPVALCPWLSTAISEEKSPVERRGQLLSKSRSSTRAANRGEAQALPKPRSPKQRAAQWSYPVSHCDQEGVTRAISLVPLNPIPLCLSPCDAFAVAAYKHSVHRRDGASLAICLSSLYAHAYGDAAQGDHV